MSKPNVYYSVINSEVGKQPPLTVTCSSQSRKYAVGHENEYSVSVSALLSVSTVITPLSQHSIRQAGPSVLMGVAVTFVADGTVSIFVKKQETRRAKLYSFLVNSENY